MEEFGSTAMCFIGALMVVGLFLLGSAIRVVPENQRLVVYRLGRELGERGPGLIFIIPVIERTKKIALGEIISKVGVIGYTKTDIPTLGRAEIEGKVWDAYGEEPIPLGSRVKIIRREGSVIVVEQL